MTPQQAPQAVANSPTPTPGYDLSKGPWFRGRFAVENTPPDHQLAAVNTVKKPVPTIAHTGRTDIVQKAAQHETKVTPLDTLLSRLANQGVVTPVKRGPVRILESRSDQRRARSKQQLGKAERDMSLAGFGKNAARIAVKALRGESYEREGTDGDAHEGQYPFQKIGFLAAIGNPTNSQPSAAPPAMAQMQAVQNAEAQMASVLQNSGGPAMPAASPQMNAASGNPVLNPKPVNRSQALMGGGPLTDGHTGLYGMKQNPLAGGSAPGTASNLGGSVKSASDIGPLGPAPQTFSASPPARSSFFSGQPRSLLSTIRARRAAAQPKPTATAGEAWTNHSKVAAEKARIDWDERLRKLMVRRGALADPSDPDDVSGE